MNRSNAASGQPPTSENAIRVIVCTLSAGGIGGGQEKMETLLHHHLDRVRFAPEMIVMNEKIPGEVSYDPSIPYRYTGLDDRFAFLLDAFSRADLVAFNGGFDPLVCEAARAAGVPCLVELMHNTEPGQAYDTIDLTVCVSETVRAIQPDPAKTAVIHNGVEVDRFVFDPSLKPAGRIVILESGRRDKPVRFHLDELAEAILPIDPRIELWLAGRGQTGASTGRVRYGGLIREIEQVYAGADIIVMLSEKEALGLCAIEAMACGCVPIVAADTGMKEVVTDGVNGFTVNAADRAAVLAAVEKAVGMRGSEAWNRMRIAARKTVKEKFDITRCVRAYESAFAELVNRKGRRRPVDVAGAEPSPDVDVADAYFFLALQRHGRAAQAVRTMRKRKTPIRHARVASMAKTLARHFAADQPHLSDIIYETLFRSGHRDPDSLKQWLGVRTHDTGFILDELMSVHPFDPEAIMLKAEADMNAGLIDEALALLEEGVRRNAGVVELRKVYEALKSKRLSP